MSLLHPVTIGSLIIENNVFLAPLAGISDVTYRIIGKKFGAGLCFTEMVSAHGLVQQNRYTRKLCKIAPEERPTAIQIFGSTPELMGKAALLLKEFKPDLIDINAGCTVPKITRSGAGVRLLENPLLFHRVIRAVVENSDVPVTVKMRLGTDVINVMENAHAAEDAGVSLITLHPRTGKQKYTQKAQWEYIKKIKEALKIPVCGNGDIFYPEDAARMIQETGCNAVMIGRMAIGNPWSIRDTVKRLSEYPLTSTTYNPSNTEKIGMALTHLKMMCDEKGEKRGIREIRRILPRYIRGMPHAASIREKLVCAQTKKVIESILNTMIKGVTL